VNAGFERLTGYTSADVLGRNCRFLQGPETNPLTIDTLRLAVREKRDVTVQLLNHRKDGSPFWNRLSVTPVKDEHGIVTHFIGVQSDVTAEKQAVDTLLRVNKQLEAANIAMQQDLQAAAELQRALLPRELPKSPSICFDYRFRPSGRVGGDCLNVLPLNDRYVGLYILDVSGHGVAAALLSVTLTHMLSVVPERSFLYQVSTKNPSQYCITPPTEVVSRLNRQFVFNPNVPRFFTIVYGILDKETREFRYVSAGHLGPIHVSDRSPCSIGETGGIPVGFLEKATYDEHVVRLCPGDRLYFCTDGITEAEDSAGEQFGLQRLLHRLEASRQISLGESLSSVMRDVDEWSSPTGAADDASMLAVECCL
jgi:PAS domain S-box-containing protein